MVGWEECDRIHQPAIESGKIAPAVHPDPNPMPRHFNTAGPCNPEIHYMLSPLTRLPTVHTLIEQQTYFIIHAPRQIGKTTAMMALAQELTSGGKYTAVLVSVEEGAAFPDDIGAAEAAILQSWLENATDRLPTSLAPPLWDTAVPGQRIRSALRTWAKTAARPLIIFIDEIDAIQDQVLISILRQLRSGYANRPRSFPQSLALIGLRDVRDYKVAAGGSNRLTTASPFNIKVESLTLRNFNAAEVGELYAQHTHDTGQIFTPDAISRAYHLTQGQPWLVNAIARQCIEVLVSDRQLAITADSINQAKDILIQRQDTHLDSLAERLKETRVRNVIEPILAGAALDNIPDDDIRFVLDLGLCRSASGSGLEIANPIYKEILPKVLSFNTISSLPTIQPSWLTPIGALNIDALLDAFLDFWRQHGQPLLRSVAYHEIAPHIVLMAFLHRVANGGGSIEREYAIGTRRMDIALRYGTITVGMELKVWRDGDKDPQEKGLVQLDQYLAGLGLDRGWLVIFDQRSGLGPIADRTTTAPATTASGRAVTVIRG
jgi:type II secretory pathway predicted ATPase ExeA